MKRSGILMTIGTGLMMAGLLTAGRAAMKSPTLLYLAGQLKMAAGDKAAGMELMSAAASDRNSKSDVVLAAEPVTEANCERTSKIEKKPVRTAKVVKKVASEPVLVAKLEPPLPPIVYATPTLNSVPPSYFHEARMNSMRIKQEMLRKAELEKQTKQLTRMAKIYSTKFNVQDFQNHVPTPEEIQHQVESSLQMAQ